MNEQEGIVAQRRGTASEEFRSSNKEIPGACPEPFDRFRVNFAEGLAQGASFWFIRVVTRYSQLDIQYLT